MTDLNINQTVYFISGGMGPKRVCSGVVKEVSDDRKTALVETEEYEYKLASYNIPVSCLYPCGEELKLMYALSGTAL